MLGQKEDKEKTIVWYYRTIAFQKPCHKDDARAVIRHLESPTVLGLVAKLVKLVTGHC